MRKLIMSLTTVASLSLAAIPVLGLASAAQAGEPAARIVVGDLDLRDPAHIHAFNARVEQEGKKLCRKIANPREGLSNTSCMARVRVLAHAELSTSQRQDIAFARSAQTIQIAGR